jgi:hypothetical protein
VTYPEESDLAVDRAVTATLRCAVTLTRRLGGTVPA